MNLHREEIINVSKLESLKRYKYFMKKIADFQELWTIMDENGEIALSDLDDKTFVPFWSAKDFIESNLISEWEKCLPFKLTLDNLEEDIISWISEKNYLINVFPVNGKSGFVVDIHEFIRDLNEELENYS